MMANAPLPVLPPLIYRLRFIERVPILKDSFMCGQNGVT
jgi:hypothetical protein